MLAKELSDQTRLFLEIDSTSDDQLELPPQLQGLRVRPNLPAGVPHKSVSEEIAEAQCTICLPTGENEAEGG